MSTGLDAFPGLAKRAFKGISVGRRRDAQAARKATEEPLARLDPRFRSPLLSMYSGEPQRGTDGQLHPIDPTTKVRPSQGMWLYDLCVSVRPKATLEIGMAYGYSTLYFLAAVANNGGGHHTAIDPFQHPHWHGIGLAHAEALAPDAHPQPCFQFIEDRSDRAATDLARAGRRFDVIFIDGNHRFDDVLVDFYLYAPLCAGGGYIVLDDMWMSSIQTVASFVRSNRRDFVEVRTGERNIAVFKRVGEDDRMWSDFHRFSVSRSA